MRVTLLFGRICSGKTSYYPDSCRIVVSNLVRDIINSTSREELQNTMHLDQRIANSILDTLDYIVDEHPHIVVDGIRQASIVHEVLKCYPDAELVWLSVEDSERKRRYESRKDIKDVEPFVIADNKPIELECQNIYETYRDKLTIVDNN